jgi:hypothetical protein
MNNTNCKMHTETLYIDPEQAAFFLSKNTHKNRTVNSAWVNTLASMMTRGAFQLSPQGIAIDVDGNLIDGQHRLLAIIESGIAVPMRVTFNCEPNTFETLDVGKKRSVRDVAIISGADPWVSNTRIIGAFDSILRRRVPQLQKTLTPAEKIEIIEANSNIARVYYNCCISKKMNFTNSSMHGALLEAMVSTVNPGAVFKFKQVYEHADIDCCYGYAPKVVLAFKNKMIMEKASKAKTKPTVLYNLTQNCFYNFVNGEERKLLKNTIEDKYIINIHDFISGKLDGAFKNFEVNENGVRRVVMCRTES